MRFWGLFLREELYQAGRVRAIGVCSFYPHVPADFCETVEVKPMVNQVELHPLLPAGKRPGGDEGVRRGRRADPGKCEPHAAH